MKATTAKTSGPLSKDLMDLGSKLLDDFNFGTNKSPFPYIFGEAFDQCCRAVLLVLRCEFNNRIYREMVRGYRPSEGCIIATSQSALELDQDGLILRLLPSIAKLKLYFGSDGEYYTKAARGYIEIDSLALTKRIESEIFHLPMRSSEILDTYRELDSVHYKVLVSAQKLAAVLDHFYNYPVTVSRLLTNITVEFDGAIGVAHSNNWYLEPTTLQQICKAVALVLCDKMYLNVSEHADFKYLKKL